MNAEEAARQLEEQRSDEYRPYALTRLQRMMHERYTPEQIVTELEKVVRHDV